MKLWSWLFAKQKRAELTNYSGGLTGADLAFALGGSRSDSGVAVNQQTAMGISALNAVVTVISEDIASLPLFVFERGDTGRNRAIGHPIYRLLHDSPNDQMTSFTWREQQMVSLLLWGNAYSYIQKINERPVALWPLSAERTRAKRQNGRLLYYTKSNDETVVLRPDQVLHVVGKSYDGIHGVSPIEQAANAFGIAISAERFSAKFFAQGTVISGYLKHPGKLSPQAEQTLINSWISGYQGLENAHKTPLLEEGMDFVPRGMPLEQAQFVEQRKWQAEEIFRLYRCPPSKAGHHEHSTFSNIEHLSIDYVRSTLRPHLVRFEAELNRKLFLEEEKKTYYTEFDADALLRGDRASQDESFSKGIQNGWYSVNDVRRMLNMNEIDGGDVYLSPLNMVPAAGRTPTDPQPEPKRSQPDRKQYKRLVADAVQRVIRKEINALRRAIGRHNIEEWANEFYPAHAELIREALRPVVETYDPNQANDMLDKFVERHVAVSRDDLTKAIQEGTEEQLLERWENRPQQTAEEFENGEYEHGT